MIRVLNKFLNSFEAFFWRLVIAIFFIIMVPIAAILYAFGFFNLKITREEVLDKDDEQ